MPRRTLERWRRLCDRAARHEAGARAERERRHDDQLSCRLCDTALTEGEGAEHDRCAQEAWAR